MYTNFLRRPAARGAYSRAKPHVPRAGPRLQQRRALPMLQLLADRFLRDSGRWFDLATGLPVTIRRAVAGSRSQQFEWNDVCAAMSRLRHPLLNPLLDYGLVASHETFEAYAVTPALRTDAVRASRAATHVARFLRSHAIALTREVADVAIRGVESGGRPGRPFGVALQPRKIADVLADLLEGGGAGPVAVTVSGSPGSGLSTLRDAFARSARIAGYVPVNVRSARRWPQLQHLAAGRHVCVISEDPPAGEARTAACWLARLGAASARRHLQVTFVRSPDPVAGSLRLDALGVAAMTGMVYVDPDFGPTAAELFDAARASDGWPGRFLASLGAESFDRIRPPAFAAHEASVPYSVTTSPAPPPSVQARAGRMASALERAERRAVDLARAGRHASAARLLARAMRLLEARGATTQAARCALRAAWIARSRGDAGDARCLIDRARGFTDDPEIQIAASIAVGTLRADDGQYVEAEAALRGAIAGAKALDRVDLARRAVLGLGRALLWNERMGEALAALEGLSDPAVPDISCEALALAGRIHAAGGDVAAALGASSQAVQRSAVVQDLRLQAAAHRAMALALAMAGDAGGAAAHAHSGLRAAQLAHLPLTALRLRAVLLRALSSGGTDRAAAQRLRESLAKAVRARALPAVVRAQVDAACDAHDRGDCARTRGDGRRDAAAIVAELVDTAQRAADDSAALGRVLEVVCERLETPSAVLLAGPNGSRVLAQYGRPWRERSLSGRRALETGLRVGVDRAIQPPEAAEPVKYAGNTIAAVACRWTAGSPVDGAAAALYLGAAALALSTHAQMLLDVREPPPHAAWGDLLGDSPAAVSLREAVQRAARAPFPVLIEGESGSGKELVARAIHRLGARRDRRFCAINCAAITDELVEAELFGHARGAFTGAATERPGLFEEADGGSLFLDEIGELSVRAQAKLLRVLQDGEVRRVGENLPRRVDVRLIAATNRRLEQEVEAGRFRADLRFRLDVVRIAVPALRDRVADIAVLAARFWQDASARVGSRATLGPDALAALSRYDWPGNVRELQNAIAWIAVHAPRRGRVGASLLPARVAASAPLSSGTFEAAREDFERRFVRAALAQTGGHRAAAARALGLSRQGLAKMLKRLGIE